jgi:curved DNA-binding protein CbpA
MNNHYQTLGLKEGASQDAIQEAYDRLSKELDPLKNGNHDFFLEEYALLQEAYNALTNNSNALPNNQQKNPIPSSNTSFKKPYLENKVKPNQDDKNFKSRIIKNVFIYAIVVIIIFLITKQNSNSHSDSDDSPVAIDTTAVAIDTAFVPPSDAIEVYETPENGFSPYNNYFGQGVYENGTNNEFVIKNSNQSDAIVCLVDYTTDLKIRNEFIRKGSTFKLSNVPDGTYYLAWFSGNDWSPHKIMMGNVEGGFQTDTNFSKSDSPSDLMECYGDRRWTITLYSVVNGNMNQTEMSENDFFKP